MDEAYPSDPPEFYVGSTNGKGFHANGRILLPIPPAIHEMTTRIVQGGKFPVFRTFNDLWRDSVAREAKWLDTLEPGTWTDRMQFHVLNIQLENEAKERDDVDKFLNNLHDEPDRQHGVKMAREALGMLDPKFHPSLLRYLEKWE